jgi:hypothetical protein
MNLQEWCLRCSQGWVVRRQVNAVAFWVCKECEGLWFGRNIGPLPEGDLSSFLNENGYDEDWSLLEETQETANENRGDGAV